MACQSTPVVVSIATAINMSMTMTEWKEESKVQEKAIPACAQSYLYMTKDNAQWEWRELQYGS